MITFNPKMIPLIGLEAQMGHLVNTINDKNEKTLSTQFLTISDFPSHIDRNQQSWHGDFNQSSMPNWFYLNQHMPQSQYYE